MLCFYARIDIELSRVNNQSFVTAKHGEYRNEKQVFSLFLPCYLNEYQVHR